MEATWLYNETVQIGTDYGNLNEVADYDRRMGATRNFAEETNLAATGLALNPEAVIWDIGTGTGELSLGLAQRCRQVYASDVSTLMLDYAAQKAAAQGVDNVSFSPGGFLSGFYPAELIDGCVSQLALHHLPDAWKQVALQRIAAVLKPGGRFFLKDLVFPDGIDDYQRFFGAKLAKLKLIAEPAMYEACVRHIRLEYSTFSWVIEGMLERAGLHVLTRREGDFLTDYSCVKTTAS